MRHILFVTQGSIGTKDATGQMLNNIFGCYNDLKVLQYSFSNINTDGLEIYPNIENVKHNDYTLFRKLLFRLKSRQSSKIIAAMQGFLRLIDEIYPPSISKKTIEQIIDYKPDLIYTLGANIQVLRICQRLSDIFDIPILVHNMDDFYNMKYSGRNRIWEFAQRALQKEYVKTYEKSYMSLAIGPDMAAEYKNTFNLPFDWVMNCAQDHSMYSRSVPCLIIFSGGLHGGRFETLVQVAKVLEGSVYKLEIFTSDNEVKRYKYHFDGFSNTSLNTYVKKEEMFYNLGRASFLLHVESSDKRYKEYFRLSMSTKIPEYLSLAKPIICIGSHEIATVSFISEYKIGIICEDVADLYNELIKHKEDDLQRLSINSKRVFYTYFHKDVMHKKLLNAIDFNISQHNTPIQNKKNRVMLSQHDEYKANKWTNK